MKLGGFYENAARHTKFWFWEVRGRKWAPGSLKCLWITAVFTRQRKGAIPLQVYEILVNSMMSVNSMGNPWIPRNYKEFQKISVLHKSVTLHETFVFPRPNWWSSPMGLPKPGNYQNSMKFQRISRISWNYVEFWWFQQNSWGNQFLGDLEGSWRPHAENVDIPIGILMVLRCPGPPRSHKNSGIPKKYQKSWNLVEFH